ncbi:hypothetical protein EVAR_9637_1 [Eumeta japonica]|uniref:CUB domain-containing protein n=1 Tax=Eumeta variegata TaxID=151549 RepID=A0A4C1TKW4_EUMVA|nr:hypothetical protein EVAR_9637_1 [Eumeta japonica]
MRDAAALSGSKDFANEQSFIALTCSSTSAFVHPTRVDRGLWGEARLTTVSKTRPRLLWFKNQLPFPGSQNRLSSPRVWFSFGASYHAWLYCFPFNRFCCTCLRFTSTRGKARGTFSSPDYPRAYPARVDCLLYTFLAAPHEIVELVFTDFDVYKGHLENPLKETNEVKIVEEEIELATYRISAETLIEKQRNYEFCRRLQKL